VVAERAQSNPTHLWVFARRIVLRDVRLNLVSERLVLRALSRNRREPRQLRTTTRLSFATRNRRQFPARHPPAAATAYIRAFIAQTLASLGACLTRGASAARDSLAATAA
jgi:hypothetical protein